MRSRAAAACRGEGSADLRGSGVVARGGCSAGAGFSKVIGFSCGVSAFLAGSRAHAAPMITAIPAASAIQSILLFLFFSLFAGAVCTPVEPKTVVIACCAATGLVFLDPALGAAGCGRVRPADGWAVA